MIVVLIHQIIHPPATPLHHIAMLFYYFCLDAEKNAATTDHTTGHKYKLVITDKYSEVKKDN